MYEHLFCSCERFLEFWPSAHWLKHDGFYTWISPSVVLHVSGKDLSNMQAFPVIVVDRPASRWGPGPSPSHWAVWGPGSAWGCRKFLDLRFKIFSYFWKILCYFSLQIFLPPCFLSFTLLVLQLYVSKSSSYHPILLQQSVPFICWHFIFFSCVT